MHDPQASSHLGLHVAGPGLRMKWGLVAQTGRKSVA